jgi:hypothetical protein
VLYAVFVLLAMLGLRDWRRALERQATVNAGESGVAGAA